jgi:hypothetical protein
MSWTTRRGRGSPESRRPSSVEKCPEDFFHGLLTESLMRGPVSYLTTCLTSLLVVLGGFPAANAAEISYARDVRPILAEFCWRCHGPVAADRQAELRLDDRDGATARAASGAPAIVPGRPASSGLVHRIRTDDADLVMPPPATGRRLTPWQIALLEDWIAAGAAFESHWAFRPLTRPAVPEPADAGGATNPVDRFVFARLVREGLPIPAAAARGTQLRRLSFAIRGLPPGPEDVREFERSTDPDAWRGAIDRGLATTAYGEHWARHWMDVVRYADSAGYELDYLFAHSHRYRDWLIRAFRDNLPMDRFLALQLAGDEMRGEMAGELAAGSAAEEAAAADAALFLAVGPRRFEGGIQREKAREYEWLTDVADTVGAAFLGLTYGCARCHDHKYESLSQREYFGLQAVFADARLDERRIGEKGGDTRPAELRVVAREKPSAVRLLRRGEVDDPGDEVAPLVPALLGGGAPAFAGPRRRADFARWLTVPGHPLTARVLVNRVWQWHFGAGLTRTPNDLGVQGEFPSHPELLDWLACELVESGWDLRHLHRVILSSRTFRAAADAVPAARDRDPDNRLLAHFPRRRLQAEELRDALLAVSGRLHDEPFGPPVVPKVEPWVLAPLRNQNWSETPDPAEWRRRTIYMVVRRSITLPFLDAFNGPDVVSSCAVRDSSVVASQALVLLNDEAALDAARGVAARAWQAAGDDPPGLVRQAWWLVFGREPEPDEVARALGFLADRRRGWAGRTPPEGLLPLPGEPASPGRPAPEPAQGVALVEWSLMLLNTNEFCHVE